MLLSQILDAGEYELFFEFSTEVATIKSDLSKNTFHLTILFAESDFI